MAWYGQFKKKKNLPFPPSGKTSHLLSSCWMADITFNESVAVLPDACYYYHVLDEENEAEGIQQCI